MKKTKLHIVHLISTLNIGGCELMLLRTLPHLDRYKHSIVTIKEPGFLAAKFQSKGISVIQAGFGKKLISIIRDKHPDLIISYLFHADMLGRFFIQPLTGRRVIPFLRTTYNHPRYLIARIMELISSPLVSNYLANSPAVRDYYCQKYHIPGTKITVIPNGVDLNEFNNFTSTKETVRSSLNIPVEDKIIINVANFHPNKNHALLIRAFGEIFQKHPNTWLIMVGSGETFRKIERIVNNMSCRDHVLLLGTRSDVNRLLMASDIFCLPTFFEGSSNALLSAMAAGLSSVVSDIPENRILVDHGKNGLLFCLNQPNSLIKYLLRILETPGLAKKLSKNGQKTINLTYSMKQIIEIWNLALDKLI